MTARAPGLGGRRASDLQADDLMRAIGRIEGTLSAIEAGVAEAKTGVAAVNARLDEHQASTAKAGALMGTLAAAGITLVVEAAKRGFNLS